MSVAAKEEFHIPFDQKGVHLPSWKELEPFPGSDDIEITIGGISVTSIRISTEY